VHSKLFSRILVVACIIVLGGMAFLGGMTLDYSVGAWNAMVAASAVESLSLNLSNDVSLFVDTYDTLTETITAELTGSASSLNGAVSVKCYRTDDLGRALRVSETGEMGALLSEYPVEVESSGAFTTPKLHLKDGENYFVVVATDVNGLSAVEVVSITYRMGTVQSIDLEHVDTTEEGVIYQNNIITLTFKPGTTPERAREIINEIGGTEVGNIAVLRRYQVQVMAGSYEDLKAQCDQYLAAYTELILAAPELISIFDTTDEDNGSSVYLPNDPWSTDGAELYWDESYPAGNNWGLECIQAPSAWQYAPYFRNFTVGVIDGGFLDGHDDLRLYFGDDRRVVDDHGTHIAGTIGALHDNHTGVSGVMNKGRVFAYPLNSTPLPDGDGFYLSESEMVYSLVSCVVNGSSVVNVSIGNLNSTAPLSAIVSEGMLIAESMASLLSEGYDFVVVQSAGNGDANGNAVDAFTNGWYISLHSLLLPEMQDVRQAIESAYGLSLQDLIDRVIVVANAANLTESEPYFELSNSSNCGDVVDIAAPGTMIYSTVSGGMLGMGTYGYMSGTSMAAPHVTAVAAMAWSTNPEITGADVKQILLDNTCYTARSAVDSPMPGYEYDIVNAYLAVKAAIEFERVETYAEITVKDAETGSVLPGATVAITHGVEPGGPSAGTYTTDAQGIVYIEMDSGDYVLNISKEGYINSVASMTLQPDVVNRSTYAVSRELGENEFRIVLTWGATPSDLDSHLIGYMPGTNDFFRVYYNEKVAGSFANLDVDDTSSYGPETVTINGLPDQPVLYCVHDYTNRTSGSSMAMSSSSATVQVMRHTETIATYTVSPNRQSVAWVLFWLMPDGTIVNVDEYTSGAVDIGRVGNQVFERGVQY